MDHWQKLQLVFAEILGIKNVYFQPPPTVKMEYPCVVYQLSGTKDDHADNRVYVGRFKWNVTLISRTPMPLEFYKLRELKNCYFDRPYTAGNLYHYSFTIYY